MPSIEELQLRTLLESDVLGIWKVDFSQPISASQPPLDIANQIYDYGFMSDCNSALVKMYRMQSRSELIGRPVRKIIADKDVYVNRILHVIDNQYKVEMVETQEIIAQGEVHFFINSYFGYIRNGFLEFLWGFQIDETERRIAEEKLKSALHEREILLKEIHHRVKNNLAIIASLLELQSKNQKEESVKEIFRESQNRIRFIALLHENLYKSEDLASIRFDQYVKKLITSLFKSYGVNADEIQCSINVENLSLDVQTTIHCGLIVTELVSNSLKYAFPSGWNKEKKIEISLHPVSPDKVELTVRDSGAGLPKDMNIENSDTLGLRLVNLLALEQMNGILQVNRTRGTEYRIVFSLNR